MTAPRRLGRMALFPLLVSLFAVAAALAAEAPALQRAKALMESGRWKKAREVVEAEVAAHPDDPGALAARARVQAAYGELAEAEKTARRAIALAPGSSEAHLALARSIGGQAQRAGMLKAMKLIGTFRKETEAAITLDPRNADAREMLMLFHLQAPGVAGGDKKKARALAEEIGRLDPVRGDLALVQVGAATKDTAATETILRRAVARDPKNADAKIVYGNWLLAPWRARWDEGAAQARAAIAADPERSGAYALLAMAQARRGNLAELDATLAESEARVPENRGPWYQAGRILLAEGKELPRAEKYFRHYVEQEAAPGQPSQAHGHWRLANVLEKEGRRPEAIAELETALRLKPDLDEAKKDLKRLKK